MQSIVTDHLTLETLIINFSHTFHSMFHSMWAYGMFINATKNKRNSSVVVSNTVSSCLSPIEFACHTECKPVFYPFRSLYGCDIHNFINGTVFTIIYIDCLQRQYFVILQEKKCLSWYHKSKCGHFPDIKPVTADYPIYIQISQ